MTKTRALPVDRATAALAVRFVDAIQAAVERALAVVRDNHPEVTPIGGVFLEINDEGELLPRSMDVCSVEQWRHAADQPETERESLVWLPGEWRNAVTIDIPEFDEEFEEGQDDLNFTMINRGVDWPPQWMLEEVCKRINATPPPGAAPDFLAFPSYGQLEEELPQSLAYVMPADLQRDFYRRRLMPANAYDQ